MIALIGMSGLFPGCVSLGELWSAIERGRDCLTRFDPAQLRKAGVPQSVLDNPGYVPVRGWFDSPQLFDAEFFGFTDTEARLIDPQQRLFLQESWRALEHAGYRPDRIRRRTGVFAGCGINTHLLFDVLDDSRGIFDDDPMLKVLGSEKDFLAARVSYKLGLTGPSVNVQTACSTSLAAVHMASQSLLSGECDMALAGGASVFARAHGYFSQPGGIVAHDGVCRPFDADGCGFVPGNGVAVVCLKRLEDAIADGDRVHLVIHGTAMVNDGSRKAGFTAPSFDGQVEAISEALALSGAPSGAIQYVEAHGTATSLGDPIEFSALRSALSGHLEPQGCALGSIKGNIGHLDTAAGVASLIKVAMAMNRGILPPIANFVKPNPMLGDGGGLLLPIEAAPWQRAPADRWACVNSLGLGGTNVHLVASGPRTGLKGPAPPRARLFFLSGRTPKLLERTIEALRAQLASDALCPMADVAHTLAQGRHPHAWRRAVVAGTPEELELRLSTSPEAAHVPRPASRVAFVFPGGGAQHASMAAGLRQQEPVYEAAYAQCRELLAERFGLQIGAAGDLRSPIVGLAELFAVEWSLAALWRSWGVKPAALLGHSAGEYAAAAVAGVFSLEDALGLVVTRGELMATLDPGGMVAVPLSAQQAIPYMADGVSLAADNGPTACVLSAGAGALAKLVQELQASGVPFRQLHIDVAAHSHLVEAILPAFEAKARRVAFKAPCIPVISSVTGEMLSDKMACDPAYWVRHLRETVRFRDAAAALLSLNPSLVIEVGPGQGLTSLMREAAINSSSAAQLVPSLQEASLPNAGDAHACVLQALGAAWSHGADVDMEAVLPPGLRVPLPLTLFNGQDLSFGPFRSALPVRSTGQAWTPVWVPQQIEGTRQAATSYWLLGDCDIARELARRLSAQGARVTRILPGQNFSAASPQLVTMRPGNEEDFAATLTITGPPGEVVHLWGLDKALSTELALQVGAASLLALHRALGAGGHAELRSLTVVSRDCVEGRSAAAPLGASTCGFGFALSNETQAMTFTGVDLDEQLCNSPQRAAAAIAQEVMRPASPRRMLVHRTQVTRRIRHYVPVPPPSARDAAPERLFITGGFGGLALAIAIHFARGGVRHMALAGTTLPATGSPASRLCGELVALGVTLIQLQCDVAQPQQIGAALASARDALGRIDTVIHAAGRLAGGVAVLKTQQELSRILQPKVDGTLALVEALRESPPDRLLLFSALDAALGTPGFTDHCAANAFMDASANWAAIQLDASVTSIAWPAWAQVGQAAIHTLPADIELQRMDLRGAGLSNAEGCNLLDEAIALRLPNLVICRPDLPQLVQQTEHMSQRILQAPAAARQSGRPLTGYQAPQEGIESVMCGLFGLVLGLDRVGVNDDFFALGGHSLLGLSLLNQLYHAFGIRLSLTTLLRNASAGKLASVVEEQLLREIATSSECSDTGGAAA